jgi:alpha-L-rhamnosidase
VQLRVEHVDDPLGIGERTPRLSWKLPDGAIRQVGYEVSLDGGTPTAVRGDAHVLVPWPGEPLSSGVRREVRVRVETDTGWSDWTDPLAVEAGLVDQADWQAHWVSTGAESGAPGHRAAYRLRGEVTVDRPVVRARLYATAYGIYELSLDGLRVVPTSSRPATRSTAAVPRYRPTTSPRC